MEEFENEGQRSVGLGEGYGQSLSWPVGQTPAALADVRNTGRKLDLPSFLKLVAVFYFST